MAAEWYFTAEQLQNSPSRKCGVDADKELQFRQQTAYLIQEMGQHLRVYVHASLLNRAPLDPLRPTYPD